MLERVIDKIMIGLFPDHITNTRAVSLKEETKESNQGGGSTGFRDPAKQAREKRLDGSVERAAQVGIS
eukprot:jgi/Psemu1/45000/gm1.45000_g